MDEPVLDSKSALPSPTTELNRLPAQDLGQNGSPATNVSTLSQEEVTNAQTRARHKPPPAPFSTRLIAAQPNTPPSELLPSYNDSMGRTAEESELRELHDEFLLESMDNRDFTPSDRTAFISGPNFNGRNKPNGKGFFRTEKERAALFFTASGKEKPHKRLSQTRKPHALPGK